MTASDKDTVDLDMNALDALFAQATNDVGAQPSEAFMTRVVTDALAQQPMPQIAPPSLWAQIAAMVGGWQGMGGLIAATCAGFWIGINPPEGLPTQFETFLGSETSISLLEDGVADTGMFGFGWDMEEG
ncbi:MAG: hypothetical protein HN456_02565 [Rhodobacteraceae bacterium]|nr:hypothetical protein [Paracoccaceae bacterium]